MSEDAPLSATQLLARIENGDRQAAAELLPLVYGELRRLAAARLAREAVGQTLQPTALVHEAYLRLVGGGDRPQWQGRAHFLGAAAEAMRRILVEAARRKKSVKHGGEQQRADQPLDQIAAPQPADDLLAIDEALNLLAAKDPVKAELVKLRYFAGLTADEAAAVLGLSPSTADRYWTYARAWLRRAVDAAG
jgi:RNA polymerase sigma factor (TIGR02999 family)